MAGADIQVLGVRELRNALRDADGRTPQELQRANKRCAEIVAREARRRAPKGEHEGGGHPQPLAAAIRAQATATRAVVAFGGSRAPHGAVVNWGGTIPRRGTTSRTRVPRQEHIYAAIGAEHQQILTVYELSVKLIARNLERGGATL
ncbi:MAG TPA: hypothetical protein VIV12_14280 [Streptosporangiaceae bacterium]